MPDYDVSFEDLELFKKKHGQQQYEAILKALGRNSILIECLKTEIGEALLKEVVDRAAELLMEIADDPDCPAIKKLEFKVYQGISMRWAGKIMNYYKTISRIKKDNKGAYYAD